MAAMAQSAQNKSVGIKCTERNNLSHRFTRCCQVAAMMRSPKEENCLGCIYNIGYRSIVVSCSDTKDLVIDVRFFPI